MIIRSEDPNYCCYVFSKGFHFLGATSLTLDQIGIIVKYNSNGPQLKSLDTQERCGLGSHPAGNKIPRGS